MRGPSLQKTAVLSTALHLTIVLLSIVILKQSNNRVMPSPYIVSLVASGREVHQNNSKPEQLSTYTKETRTGLPADKPVSKSKKDKKEEKTDMKRVEERISELAAKKRIERVVKLRSIISLKGKGEQVGRKAVVQNTNIDSSKGTFFDAYYSKITNEIWKEWIYTDVGNKNLETIVFVKIFKDGAIIVQGIEKSSGNILFDRSALKAIAKASPVSPPPYDMEIGIRFYP